MRPTEHIEPVAPIGERRRGRTALTAVVPVVILAGVVGLGVIGNLSAPQEPREPAAPTARPSPPATPPAPSASEAVPAPRDGAPFPRRILGIRTMDAADATRMERAGISPDRLLAVVGWLSLGPPSPDCAKAWELCRRIGLLSDVPTVDGGGAVFLETRPDVTVSGREHIGRRADSWSVPATAVIVGRFAPRIDRECGLRRPVCAPVFAAELIAWLDGGGEIAVRPRGAAIRGATLTADEATAVARRAIPRAGQVIAATLVDRDRLATLEQDAATIALTGTGPVWLVRTVSFGGPPGFARRPLAGWAVVDDASGRILAAYPDDRTGASSGAIARP